MSFKKHLIIVFVCMTMASASASQEQEPGQVFARIGDIVLTLDMLDAAFSRVPDEHRLAFIRDRKKVEQLTKQILTNMAVAEQARAAGYDQEPHVKGRAQLAVNKTLTEAWLEEQERLAPEPDYEALAREFYQLNPDQFMTEPTYDATHLLIKTESRTEDEARALAQRLRQQVIKDPSEFDRLIEEYSEARNAPQNRGRLTGLKPGQTVPEFEAAAQALESPGDISDIVRTSYGFHIIRLDDRTESKLMEFDEVKGRLMKSQEARYKDQIRVRTVTDAISVAPLEYPDGAIEKMLKRYFGEEFEETPNP